MLGREDVEAIDRDGYVVLRDVLDAATIARLLRAFEAAPQERGTQHVRVSVETPEHDAWRAIEQHAIVRAVSDHVLGRPFVIGAAHGRNPLPGFGGQGLHADWRPLAARDPFAVVTFLWMLDEFTVENGATRVVPGTHRAPGMVPKELAQPLAHHPREAIVTGRAGSVIALNGHLWHSGRKNESRAPRRAIQMSVIAADAAGAEVR